MGWGWGRAGARAPLALGNYSPLCTTRVPSGFPFLLSLSRRSSAATRASRDLGLSGHVMRERPRWGGIRALLPALRKRNTDRACAMVARFALATGTILCFLFRNRRLGGRRFFRLSFPPIASLSMDAKRCCCC